MMPNWIQNLGGGFLERVGIGVVSSIELLGLGFHKDRNVIKLVKQSRWRRRSLVTAAEAFMVYTIARAQEKLPGDMAEVGVFQGSTAKLICEAKNDKNLRLFDTFEGLPRKASQDGNIHREGQYTSSLESVRRFLHGYANVTFHKGLFPDSAHDVEDADYCFAHFDVDLYESTLACLEYFYPRMTRGGIMLSHDYSVLQGVQQAFTEFLVDKPEGVIELSSTQCMVVRI